MESMLVHISLEVFLMSKVQKIFLKQKVIPTIIMFGLLPKSVFYISMLPITAYILISVFASVTLAYLLIRYIVIIKYIDHKRIIIYDTLCAIVGLITACVYNEDDYYALLCCVMAIPLYVDNYKVLMKTCQSKDG